MSKLVFYDHLNKDLSGEANKKCIWWRGKLYQPVFSPHLILLDRRANTVFNRHNSIDLLTHEFCLSYIIETVLLRRWIIKNCTCRLVECFLLKSCLKKVVSNNTTQGNSNLFCWCLVCYGAIVFNQPHASIKKERKNVIFHECVSVISCTLIDIQYNAQVSFMHRYHFCC